MKRLMWGLPLVFLAGCQAQPMYAPFGSQIFLSTEAVDTEPGALFPLEASVILADENLALNNVLVEFFSHGAILLPPEAISGASNQPSDTDGDGVPDTSAVSWCDAYSDDAAAYQACFEEYYFQATSVDLEIGPTYARIPTDRRGVARIYVLAFCFVVPDDGLYCGDGTEDLTGAVEVTIGVDNAQTTISYTAD